MELSKLLNYLEELAPLSYQESYDNSGLIVGEPGQQINRALISLDCTEEVIDEAIQSGANLIISHHPIVFKGLKRFNNAHYVERVIAKAIQHHIALYAIHTNLDNIVRGVNSEICSRLELQHTAILMPKSNILEQLVVYVPRTHAQRLRDALFQAGAGNISSYSECSFSTEGVGTFKPNEGAEPFVGEIGKRQHEEEDRIEVIYPQVRQRRVLLAMFQHHPYEEVAYNVYALGNQYQEVGAGMIGNLARPMGGADFLRFLKKSMDSQVIRHTNLLTKPVQRIAVCGGAGSFLLHRAIASGADVFVTADFKYHDFFEADGKIVIADIGHFESEQFTQGLLLRKIQKKFPNFAIRLTRENTNPIKYYF